MLYCGLIVYLLALYGLRLFVFGDDWLITVCVWCWFDCVLVFVTLVLLAVCGCSMWYFLGWLTCWCVYLCSWMRC